MPSLPRLFGARLSETFRQQGLVDNRASASGAIAAPSSKLPCHAVNNFTPITQLTAPG